MWALALVHSPESADAPAIVAAVIDRMFRYS